MKYISIAFFFTGIFRSDNLLAQQLELRELLKGKYNVEEIMEIVEQYYKDHDEVSEKANESEQEDDFLHWARWGYYMSSRTDAHGNLVNVDKLNRQAYERYQSQNRSSTGNWVTRGPTNVLEPTYGVAIGMARVDRIAFDPFNASILYAGTPCGGLFKSVNGGSNWTAMTDNIPSIAISGIVVSHADPQDVYILTGDGDSDTGGFVQDVGYWRPSAGVFVSHDGGINWESTTPLPITGDYAGYNLAQNPVNANVLLAATTAGLYRSSNAGSSWTQVLNGRTYEVAFKPGSSTIVYASQQGEFFRSENGGVTWNEITDFGSYDLPNARVAITVSAANPEVVYVLSGAGPTEPVENCENGEYHFGGIFRSGNSGQSFAIQSDAPNLVESCCQGTNSRNATDYDLAIGASHEDEDILFAGGILLWKSSNHGWSWSNASADECDPQSSSSGYVHADIHDIEYNPLNGYVYVACDGGLLRSTNDGADWTALTDGIAASMAYHMAGTPDDLDNMIIGLQDNGCKRRNTNSTAWDHCIGGDGFDCIYNWNSATEGYFGSNAGVYRFWNNGANRTGNLSPINEMFLRITTAVNNPALVLVGGPNIYKSLNNGLSWDDKGASGFWDIERCPSNANKFYAAGGASAFATAGLMFKSEDAGNTWIAISNHPGYPIGYIRLTDIEVRPINSANVWITFGGYQDGDKVFFSSNSGDTWQNMSGTLPNVPINAIQVDAANNAYVGTDIGVFYRGAGWDDWVPFWHRLPIIPVSDLELYEADDIIRASTFGRGVWESSTYSTCLAGLNISIDQSGHRYYEVSDSISCDATFFGGQNTKIVMKSNDYIILKTGFHAPHFNTVHMYNAPCGEAQNED